MAEGVVTSTPEAIQAIDSMKRTISGGLLEAINTLITHGDSLHTGNFDGAAAANFYSEWPATKQALNTALERLGMMSDDIMTVNTNIQTAGGNL